MTETLVLQDHSTLLLELIRDEDDGLPPFWD